MRATRRPPWTTALRFLAALAVGVGAYSVYIMACGTPSTAPTAPSITGQTPYATYEQPYSEQLSVSPNSGHTYTWSIDQNTTWPGLSIDPSTGVIHGTPTTVGVWMPKVTATDTKPGAPALTGTLCINVWFEITPAELPQGTANVIYSVQLGGLAGPPLNTPNAANTMWTAIGAPTGLQLSPGGKLTGTLAAGQYIFTVQDIGQDIIGAGEGRKVDTLVINAGPTPLTITTPSPLPMGTVGVAYDLPGVQFAATGGTPGQGGAYTWGWANGSAIPPGLILSSTGLLHGSPTAASPSANYMVQVTDAAVPPNVSKATFALTVALGITPTTLPGGTVGSAYSQPLTAAGGGTPYSWTTSGNVPPGLMLDPVSGTLHGTPTTVTASPFTFTAKVSDNATPANTGSQLFTVGVVPSPITITTSTLPEGAVAASYDGTGFSFAATGGTGPYMWTITSMPTNPDNLSLSSGGVLSGMPASAGAFTFTVKVADAASHTNSGTFTVNVLGITTPTPLPTGTAGSPYNISGLPFAATGGTGTYTWAITSSPTNPAGLTLSTGGLLSGTPTAGTFTFTVKVTDATSTSASMPFMLTVNATGSLTFLTGQTLLVATNGTSYSNQFSATGGTAPYTWMTTPGQPAPAGLGMSTAGRLFGTPTGTAPPTTFPVTVMDNAGHSMTSGFMLTVQAPSAVCTIEPTTAALPNAKVGVPYTQAMYAEPASLCNASDLGYSIWSVSSGGLPAGFTLNPLAELGGTTGATTTTLSSTGPVTAAAGTYNFTITWHGQDTMNPIQGQNASQSYSLIITP